MKILHVISSANPNLGGPIEAVKQLNQAVKSLGHTTEIVSLDAPDAPWLADFSGEIHAVGPPNGSYYYAKGFAPWLKRHADDYDHVIINGLWQYPSFAAWKTLRALGKPYVVYTHGMLDPYFKRAYPLKHLKKSLYWPWGEYPVLRDAQAVCFTCEEERILARQSFQPYRCREVVVSLGTSAPDGDPKEQKEAFLTLFPQLRGKRLLLFLSRIHVKKGCDLLIEAFAQVAGADPTLHLVMAGPDQTGWQAHLEALAEKRGIAGRITWTGMLSGDLKWGAFHAAEVFVLPSHQENFGIVVAEAMACGLPVLISNKVNIWREISADDAGLVEDDTAQGAAKMLQTWLALPPERKKLMAQNAAESFTKRFEITQAAQSLLQVLQASAAQV